MAARSGSRALRLSSDEVDLLWTAVARAVDPRVAARMRDLFGGDARSGITVAHHIALAALSTERSRALLGVVDPRHPLREYGLLVPTGPTGPLEPCDVSSHWTVPARVWGHLLGDDRLDPVVTAVGGFVTPFDDRERSPLLSARQDEHIAQLRGWLAAGDRTVIVVEGASGSGRRTAVAIAAERPVIAVDFACISARRAESVLGALRREVALLGAVPVLANLDELWSRLQPGDETRLALAEIAGSMPAPVVVTASTPGIDLHASTRTSLRLRWPVPEPATRRALWERVIDGALAPDALDLVAMRFEMGAGGIRDAAHSASHRARQRGAVPGLDEVIAGVQDNIAERLGELAQRVDVRQDWSELALSPDTHDDVRAMQRRG